jgi:hypothetical protein
MTFGFIRVPTSKPWSLDPWTYTTFLQDARNLSNQWVLLERRAGSVLPKEKMAELRLVTKAYQRFMNEEVSRITSGWWFTDDREKLENFEKVYAEWYKVVEQYDEKLPSYVARPEVSLGPSVKDDPGLLEKAKRALDRTVQDRVLLPMIVTGAVGIALLWVVSSTAGRRR